MHDVFISYPRRDRDRVVPLATCLQGLGLDCFFDIEGIDSGEQFPDVIDRAVKTAKCVLGVWSPYALSRDWVRKECRIGQSRGVLVTARIEDIEELEIPTEFGRPQLADLTTFYGSASHRGFLELLKAVSDKCGRNALNEMALAALSMPAIDSLQRVRAVDEKALRAAWDDLKTSSNIERIVRFRDDYARDSLLEFSIAERLEQIANELVTAAEALYPTLTRARALRDLRNPSFWKPRHDSYQSHNYALAPAYDPYSATAPDAYRMFVKAAELGNGVAMAYVAIMQHSGLGTSTNIYEAGRWCTKALAALR